jgi:hypothetical protein
MIEDQSPFGSAGTVVAFVTMLDQDRSNPFLEELHLLVRELICT